MQPRQDWKKNNKKRKQNNSNNNDERPEQVNIKQCFKYINIYTLDTTPFNIFHIYMRQYTKERQPNNPLFCFHIASFSPNSKRFAALNLLFFWLLLWWRLVVFIVLRKNYEFDFELYYYSPICGIIFTASDSVIWLALHWACVFFCMCSVVIATWFLCFCILECFLSFYIFEFQYLPCIHTHTHSRMSCNLLNSIISVLLSGPNSFNIYRFFFRLWCFIHHVASIWKFFTYY